MIDILERLVSFRSISPKDDGCLNYVSDILLGEGFDVHIMSFGAGEEETKNLYAVNKGEGKNLCFAGHIDVVPAGDLALWDTDPFTLKIEGERIFGRGVVDMKGAVAAMLKAVIDYSKSSKGKVSILLTSDEEASAKFGTKEMLKWMEDNGHKIDYTIVGEPTSSKNFGDTIKLGRRGSINLDLEIIGKQGHAAYPELAINPNKIIVEILHKLNNLKLDEGNEYFDPSNLEITSIDTSNIVRNLIPSSAAAKFNVRFNNTQTKDQIIDKITKIIEDFSDNFKLKHSCSAEPFLSLKTNFAEEFLQIVQNVTGQAVEFSTSGGTSDARFIRLYSPVLEFGLLNETAHKVNENTEITHLQKLYTVYYMAIESFHNALKP